MSLDYPHFLALAGILVVLSLLAGRFFSRYGLSSLLITLFIGILIGNGGEYDFDYNYPELTLHISEVALCIIIFAGGFQSDWKPLRPWVGQGVTLATFGVLCTCGVVGLGMHYLLGWPWLRALLLGAVISSTDAAAVFSILKESDYRLKNGIRQTLELESGTNDPMAYFLVLSLSSLLLHSESQLWSFGLNFISDMGIGVASGLLVGKLAIFIIQKAKLEDPQNGVILLAFIIILYAVNQLFDGSAFLAMYCAGMLVGNSEWKKSVSTQFLQSLSWLNETILFLILGLQVYLFQLEHILKEGLWVAAILLFAARPVGVFLSLIFFKKRNWKEKTFISWVGLRGATPIVFGLVPVVDQISHAEEFFNVSFIVVISSILIQGMSVGKMAQWTGVKETLFPD